MKRIFGREDDRAIAKNLVLLLRAKGFIVYSWHCNRGRRKWKLVFFW